MQCSASPVTLTSTRCSLGTWTRGKTCCPHTPGSWLTLRVASAELVKTPVMKKGAFSMRGKVLSGQPKDSGQLKENSDRGEGVVLAILANTSQKSNFRFTSIL